MGCRALGVGAMGLIMLLWLVGCDKPSVQQSNSTVSDGGAVNSPDGESAQQSLESQIEESFASLSPEDQDAAHKQGFCPIGDGQLGTMGPPVKITLRGQDVFLCCEHCRSEAEADADKTLERVAALLEKAQDEDVRLRGATAGDGL